MLCLVDSACPLQLAKLHMERRPGFFRNEFQVSGAAGPMYCAHVFLSCPKRVFKKIVSQNNFNYDTSGLSDCLQFPATPDSRTRMLPRTLEV